MPSLKIGLLLATFALSVIGNAQAQSITIDFDELAQGGDGSDYVDNGYATDGYVFTSNADPIFADQAFGIWQTDNSAYNGSTALFNTFVYGLAEGATTTLSREDGSTFALESIDLGQLFPDSGSDTPVVFIGTRSDGSSVTTSFTLPATSAPATYSFQGAFVDLLSVRWEQLPQFHQFDNLVLVSAAIPEPTTGWLVAAGCCLLLVTCRRQRATDSRASLIPIPASTSTPRPRTAHSEYRR